MKIKRMPLYTQMENVNKESKHPWRIETNSRYKDVVKMIINFSVAALSIPIFVPRTILGIDPKIALIQIFDCRIYWGWVALVFSILSGIIFYYASAQWIRLAWGLDTKFMCFNVNNKSVENILDWSFWSSIIFFLLGLSLTLWFLVSYKSIGP
jgi:hypothetical protein